MNRIYPSLLVAGSFAAAAFAIVDLRIISTPLLGSAVVSCSTQLIAARGIYLDDPRPIAGPGIYTPSRIVDAVIDHNASHAVASGDTMRGLGLIAAEAMRPSLRRAASTAIRQQCISSSPLR